MLRFALTSLSVVAFAAVTAGLLQVAAPSRNAQPPVPYLSTTVEAALQLCSNPSQIPSAIAAGVENTLSAVVPGVAPRDPATKVGTSTVLLNQDVSVLDKHDHVWRALPKGTNVQVVSGHGRFVQVRHEQSTITIPRGVIQNGLVKTTN